MEATSSKSSFSFKRIIRDMKWQWNVFQFLRYLNKVNLEAESNKRLTYTRLGNETTWLPLSDVVVGYNKEHPKISQARVNKIAVYAAAALEPYLDTQTIKIDDEDTFVVSLSYFGHRFIDLDLGFVPTRLIIAWYKEDGKAVIAAFTAILGLLSAILFGILRIIEEVIKLQVK